MNEIDVDEILNEFEDDETFEVVKSKEQAQAEDTDDNGAADGEDEISTPAIDLEISSDKLYAYITISQDPPQPYQVTVDQLYDVLSQAKVEYGVMLDKLDLIVANKEYPTRELIAVGKEMVPGIDAGLQFLISTEMGGRPKDLGHYVDHRDLNLVENVTAGQVLVRKIPSQEGEPGMSVHGQPIRAPRVKDVRLPAGKGTKVSETNPLELVATRDGFVRLDKRAFNRIVVEDIYEVKGDVDLSIGNLDIDGSVKIFGSVREGFTIKATGNIQILKRVEAAVLDAGGTIEVSGGIIGGKRGAVVEAKENVIVKFADHTTIKAGETITIADELLNCQVQADDSIIVGGTGKSAGAIIGGFISAGQEIRAASVGTEAGILTRLRVGEYSAIVERRRAMQADIKTQENKLNELKHVIASLNKRQKERSQSQAVRAQQKTKLKQQQMSMYQQMKAKLAQAKQSGQMTSLTTIDALEEEIKTTHETLGRIESSIETLIKRLGKKTSVAENLKNKKTLEQFQAAHENLTRKLTDLENQLAQRSANPWGNLSQAERYELEKTQTHLRNVQAQLNAIEAEEDTDQKIEEALAQLHLDVQTVQEQLAIKREELELVKQQIEALHQKPSQIIISGKLWSGTEVIIDDKRRRFTRDREGVKLQVSADDAIVVLNLD